MRKHRYALTIAAAAMSARATASAHAEGLSTSGTDPDLGQYTLGVRVGF